MQRILDLYDHPPADGRVICVDEFGPLNLLPRKGKAWRPQAKPKRLRATYHRNADVRTWCADNQIELIYLPTCGSWLNWIEAEFVALRHFSLGGTDHRSPRRAERRHRRLHPLAQRPSRAQPPGACRHCVQKQPACVRARPTEGP
ncbi:transposase [Lentzea alba]|uniref:transposase n=1 Tax=Lentzea alba TaxID=2714351 RepID=UPI0036F2A0E4